MSTPAPIDITDDKDDVRANSLLCAFNTPVRTAAGVIDPQQDGMVLTPTDDRPRKFSTASGAIEVLRRLTRQTLAQ